jgi:hypothetical protein
MICITTTCSISYLNSVISRKSLENTNDENAINLPRTAAGPVTVLPAMHDALSATSHIFPPFLNWPSVNKSLGAEKRANVTPSSKYILSDLTLSSLHLHSTITLQSQVPLVQASHHLTTLQESSIHLQILSYLISHGHQINGSRPPKAQPIPNTRRILIPLVHKTRTSHCSLLPRPRRSTLRTSLPLPLIHSLSSH